MKFEAQLNTTIRMVSPDFGVLIAQAQPWSPSTGGAIQAPAAYIDLEKEEDLAQYKGKLAGKIVLIGKLREVKPAEEAIFTRLDDKKLSELDQHPRVSRKSLRSNRGIGQGAADM